MVFLFGFSNFILILYNFVPQFKDLVPLYFFAVIVFVIIIPLGIYIGNIHNKRQMPTESKIQATHHAYRDIIVPNSKEVFAIKSTIFNQEIAIWQTDFSQWNVSMLEKQFTFLNSLAKSNGLEPVYTDEDFKKISVLKSDLDKWKIGLTDWQERNKKYLNGVESSKIV